MTQENKQLLLKDLSARLSYGVIGSYQWKKRRPFDRELTGSLFDELKSSWNSTEDSEFLPYLRPMSSMTEEEAKELLFVRLASKYGESCAYIRNFIKLNEVSFRRESHYEESIAVWFSFENKIHDTPQTRGYSKCEYLGQITDITLAEIDWLNAHHFDYRGLIPKDLAISTNEFNPYKD